MNRDPGVDVPNIFLVGWVPSSDRFQGETTIREDLGVLRSLPGVKAATVVNAVPLSGGGSSTSIFTEPNEKGTRADINYFEVDEHGLDTFGVTLTEGRNFDPTIVTKPQAGQVEKSRGTALSLQAALVEGGARIEQGLVWRVY